MRSLKLCSEKYGRCWLLELGTNVEYEMYWKSVGQQVY
jgi:hypothetical protein